ncbi:MAG: ABC transporter ATP-binding protein [Roseibium sp.]|nr:ABC transporter ATP-binding protein [Roseibium sp.]
MAQTLGAILLSMSCAALLQQEQQVYGLPVAAALAAGAAAAIGLFVVQCRFAERFALSYVHDVRMAYARHAMLLPFDAKSPGIGLSLTRLVNDLTAIKLWLAKGLVALITLVPTLLTLGTWIAATKPEFVPPFVGSLVVWAAGLAIVLRPLRISICKARQTRGAMAVLLGRSLPERLPLLLHGKLTPILEKLARKSGDMCRFMTARATWSGVLRAISRFTFPCAVGLYAVTGMPIAADIALFLLIFAFLASQLEAGAAGLEYFEANKIAHEKLAPVFARPALRPLAQIDTDGAIWRQVLTIRDLELPSGQVMSATIPSGTCTKIVRTDQRDAHHIALSLCGLSGLRSLECVRLGENRFSDIECKTIWRNVALVSPMNGIPLYQLGRPAHEFGTRKQAEIATARDLAGLLNLPAELLLPENAKGLCDQDRLKIRLARAFSRAPRVLVVQDDGLFGDLALTRRVKDLAENRGITLVLLENGPRTPD